MRLAALFKIYAASFASLRAEGRAYAPCGATRIYAAPALRSRAWRVSAQSLASTVQSRCV
jgi:hypothetical protein